MRRKRIVALVFCLFLIGVGAANAQDASATPNVAGSPTPVPTFTLPPTNTPSPLVQHVVRPGENLYRIALRYGTTVAAIAQENGITNPALIRVGATLRIPGVAPVPTPVPATSAPTPVPPQTTTYTVRPGDTLFRIALNNRTTVAEIVALNNIPNRNVIYVGQVLRIVASTQQTVSPANAAVSSPATTVLASGAGYARGIEVYLAGQDVTSLVNDLQALGVSWVKVRVNWRDYEPAKGQIDFGVLDGVVDTLSANQFKILFTVSKAPDWSRSTASESGPSDNVADFAAFMDALAKQYAGRVAAYEIWDEPNLRREWNSTVYG
ncbi:MAG: LysM peptidoglycan-binding domain-containing protein, partial [Anaerolineae bacterium]|nr:LysM peptidoglycan-binding domain-containing protein [Anaerolineae bacterium]